MKKLELTRLIKSYNQFYLIEAFEKLQSYVLTQDQETLKTFFFVFF